MDFRKFYIPTVIAGLALLTSGNQAQADTTSDLTGIWTCGSSTTPVYIRQVGSQLWDFSDGGTYTNAFYGSVLNGFIDATWADLPKEGNRQYGYVSGRVISATAITLNYTFVTTGGVTSSICTRP